MSLTRRGFFGRTLGALAAAWLTPFLPTRVVEYAQNVGIESLILEPPTFGIVGGINRATFSFWRNQPSVKFLATDGNRLLGYGVHETADGDATI